MQSLTQTLAANRPQVQAWNDGWQAVDFAYGFLAFGYNDLQSTLYGDTCFSSVLDLGFTALEWGQTFNTKLDLSDVWKVAGFIYFLFTAANTTTTVALTCLDSYATNTTYQWYKLFAFGQPEGQTYEDISDTIQNIKLELVQEEVTGLLEERYGEEAVEIAMAERAKKDKLGNFEADENENKK